MSTIGPYRLQWGQLRIDDNVLLVCGTLRGAESEKVELERRGAAAQHCEVPIFNNQTRMTKRLNLIFSKT